MKNGLVVVFLFACSVASGCITNDSPTELNDPNRDSPGVVDTPAKIEECPLARIPNAGIDSGYATGFLSSFRVDHSFSGITGYCL